MVIPTFFHSLKEKLTGYEETKKEAETFFLARRLLQKLKREIDLINYLPKEVLLEYFLEREKLFEASNEVLTTHLVEEFKNLQGKYILLAYYYRLLAIEKDICNKFECLTKEALEKIIQKISKEKINLNGKAVSSKAIKQVQKKLSLSDIQMKHFIWELETLGLVVSPLWLKQETLKHEFEKVGLKFPP